MAKELLNKPLLASIEASGLTREELARRCEVNAKSIWMWTHRGQIPHMRTQLVAAEALGVNRTFLWPETFRQAAITSAAEEVANYVNRGQVPADLWTGLARRATERICVAVYAGLLWFESSPGLLDVLKDRADNGVKVNIALGDPDSPAVQLRGQDEGINMSARIRNTMKFIEPVVGYPGIEIRQHGTTLHNSMYIFDDVMLVNTHIYGVPACNAPVRHFQRFSAGSYFDLYKNSFECIWSQTQPGL
jgi:transcriptional regulator with XRE-family HTH domain